MRRQLSILLAFLLLGAALALAQSVKPTPPTPVSTRPAQPVKLRTFTTPYYMLYTDLDDDGAREAWIRMTKMFETYKRRTAGFSGDIKERFPFYLYKNADDYFAAGAPPDTAGVFTFSSSGAARLMAIAGETPTAATWQTVQHEAFHQFAYAVIRGDIPTWLNEGMAEYFAEAIFTGDDFVTGVVPPSRLKAIQAQIDGRKFLPIKSMMQLTSKQWTSKLEGANYDQAWSMVQFLAHAEDGKYQKPFIAYMNQIGSGKKADDAWKSIFGQDTDAFQKKWEEWWMAQAPLGTLGQYQQATLMTLAGYLGRAASQGQIFATTDAFLAAAEKGDLKFDREDWLPPALLKRALRELRILGDVTLEPAGGGHPARLIATPVMGDKLTASYTLNGTRIRGVTIEITKSATKTPATTAPTYERVRD